MLIKLHIVRYRDGHDNIDEELINLDHVVRMSPCDIPDSLAKTYLFFPQQPSWWQQIKVTESIDEILEISNKANYRKLAHDVGRGIRLLKLKLTKEQFEELWENGYLKEAITDDDSGMDND